MIAVDTDVLVRLLTRDDADRFARAEKCFREDGSSSRLAIDGFRRIRRGTITLAEPREAPPFVGQLVTLVVAPPLAIPGRAAWRSCLDPVSSRAGCRWAPERQR